MPFLAVPAIAGAIASAGIAVGATATLIANVIVFAVTTAISIGLSALSSALQGKPRNPLGALADRAQTVRQPITVRRVIYGELRVGGPITFLETEDQYNPFIKNTDSYLHILITLASHEVEEIGAIYFNDDLVPVRLGGGAERIGIGKYSGSVGIWTGNGTTAGDARLLAAMTHVTGGKWTVNHKQEGCAKIFLRLRHNPNIFPSGIPNITCLVKGKKLVDPRDGSTRYSTNPALAIRDYLTNTVYGLGDPVINDTLCIASANVCDEGVITSPREATFIAYLLLPPTGAPKGFGTFAPTRASPRNYWPNRGGTTGTHKYAYTFYDSTGETLASPLLVLVVQGAPAGGLQLTFKMGPEGTVGRKLYRTVANGSQLKLLATIADNSTTTYGDLVLDANLGANVPTTSKVKVRDDIRITAGLKHDLGQLTTGLAITLSSTGTLPAPLLPAVDYFVIRSINQTFYLATTKANALANIFIDITTVGDGEHKMETAEETRYSCEGTIETDVAPREAISGLLTAMMGKAIHQGGQWNIYPGSYFAPTVELTADDLDGEIDATFMQTQRESFNGVKGVYINKLDFYQPTDFPPVVNETYLAEDQGVRVWQDLNLGFTLSGSMAQRIAKIELEKTRQQIVIKLKCKLTAFRILAGEVFTFTYERYGWARKPFEIQEWRLTVRQGKSPTIGVDIIARETASGIYDWKVGEETFVDLAPNATLPDPFNINPPGEPEITEEIYETSGSAGVKSRAVVSWDGSSTGLVKSYQLEFKGSNETGFNILTDIQGRSYFINDLEAGFYDFRIKAYSSLGVSSGYTDIVRAEMIGLSAPPDALTNFTVAPSNGLALVTWALHHELDVRIGGEIIIRHTSKESGAVWEDGRQVGLATGDAVNALVPLVTGTYMGRVKDSTGNISAGIASFVATEGLVTGFNVAFTSRQAPGFAGVKTNVALADAKLSIDDTSSLIGTYEFNEGANNYIDMAAIVTRRFESDINLLNFVNSDFLDSRGLIDTWADLDGGQVDGGQVILYASITGDNPSRSPEWSPWIPFTVADFTCRAVKFKLELITDEGENNVAVSLATVHVKTPT